MKNANVKLKYFFQIIFSKGFNNFNYNQIHVLKFELIPPDTNIYESRMFVFL